MAFNAFFQMIVLSVGLFRKLNQIQFMCKYGICLTWLTLNQLQLVLPNSVYFIITIFKKSFYEDAYVVENFWFSTI